MGLLPGLYDDTNAAIGYVNGAAATDATQGWNNDTATSFDSFSLLVEGSSVVLWFDLDAVAGVEPETYDMVFCVEAICEPVRSFGSNANGVSMATYGVELTFGDDGQRAVTVIAMNDTRPYLDAVEVRGALATPMPTPTPLAYVHYETYQYDASDPSATFDVAYKYELSAGDFVTVLMLFVLILLNVIGLALNVRNQMAVETNE